MLGGGVCSGYPSWRAAPGGGPSGSTPRLTPSSETCCTRCSWPWPPCSKPTSHTGQHSSRLHTLLNKSAQSVMPAPACLGMCMHQTPIVYCSISFPYNKFADPESLASCVENILSYTICAAISCLRGLPLLLTWVALRLACVLSLLVVCLAGKR